MEYITEHMLKTRDCRQEHLRLDESCVERGGNYNNFRGVLAEYLNTSFPQGQGVQCCHACNNEKCSNPKHMYWGTASENSQDAVQNGTNSIVKLHQSDDYVPWNKGITWKLKRNR